MTLNKEQVALLVSALEYSIEHGYEGNCTPPWDAQYDDLCELLEYLKLGV